MNLGVGKVERKREGGGEERETEKQSKPGELDLILSGWPGWRLGKGVGGQSFRFQTPSLSVAPAPRAAVPRAAAVGKAPGHFIREVCFHIHPLSPIKSLT